MNKMILSPILVAYLSSVSASKDSSASSSLFSANKEDYWLMRLKFDGDSTCSQDRNNHDSYIFSVMLILYMQV